MRAMYVSETILSTFHTLSYFTLTTIMWGE